MAPTETKTCQNCGKKFESPLRGGQSSSTVNCPDCRGKKKDGGRRISVYKTTPVDSRGKTCTVTTGTKGKCGKPAVYSFRTSSGDIFSECAEHHK